MIPRAVTTFLFALIVPLCVTEFIGCAATGETTEKSGHPSAERTQLQALRPGLNTPQDSLVLDMLIGYQALLLHAASTDSVDAGILRQSQNAFGQLEYMLRYGGVASPGREGRVVTLPDGTRLTLQEAVQQMSHALLQVGNDKDWKLATDRAREIQKHKPDLSALVEDANWVLALSAALESPLPEEVKQRLRHLHESYAREDSHDLIAQQVNDLLPEIKNDTLRRELKKLANRSWDRNKRKASPASAALPPISVLTPKNGAAPASPISAPVIEASSPDTSPNSMALSEKEAGAAIDSLSALGQYLEALRVLETVEGLADAKWVAARRQSLGNHYCEDRRNAAAMSFIAARKETRDSARTAYLRASLSALDSCLFQFPDAPVAAKVRRNRTLVEKELGH